MSFQGTGLSAMDIAQKSHQHQFWYDEHHVHAVSDMSDRMIMGMVVVSRMSTIMVVMLL